MKDFLGYKKGINLGGWLSQCVNSKKHYDTFIKENDIKEIKSWGVDHIRVPISYELVEDEEGVYIEDGFKYIDKTIKWCNKYELNLIIDLHKTAGYSFDEIESSVTFFENENLQKRFISLWKGLSERYGKYNEFVSFELLNEIVDSDVAEKWNDIANKAIVEIRKYAPYTKILIGGVRNNCVSSVKMLDVPYDENIVYNFHFYEPTIFTHQSAYWIKEMSEEFSISYPNYFSEIKDKTNKYLPVQHDEIFEGITINKFDKKFFEIVFSEAIQVAKDRNVPLYCGEYGVIDRADVTSTLKWYADINSVFEKYNIGRAAWNYKGKDFGITDEHYKPIFNNIIKLL